MNANLSPDYLAVDVQQSAPIRLNVQFSCKQHELIVLVGPSGSGKTTLLRTLAGLYRTAHSHITCAGKTWSNSNKKLHLPPQRRHTGLVFQNYALFPHLSVARNIELACRDLSGQKKLNYIGELLRLVNLDGLEERLPAELSGGQQQRVAVARALARKPAILLLDEPFSAVDQVTRRKLRRELTRLKQQLHIPILLVTHDLDEARMFADRMCILHDGTLLQTGTPAEVFSRPATALVARLVDLGNIFSGEILRHDPVKNLTYLHWGNHELECKPRPEFQPGTTVDWVIPPDSVILHRRNRPSRGEHENPVSGIIEQAITLGENTSIEMRTGNLGAKLSFMIHTHVARRNDLAAGATITVSLLADAIHLMPPLPVFLQDKS